MELLLWDGLDWYFCNLGLYYFSIQIFFEGSVCGVPHPRVLVDGVEANKAFFRAGDRINVEPNAMVWLLPSVKESNAGVCVEQCKCNSGWGPTAPHCWRQGILRLTMACAQSFTWICLNVFECHPMDLGKALTPLPIWVTFGTGICFNFRPHYHIMRIRRIGTLDQKNGQKKHSQFIHSLGWNNNNCKTLELNFSPSGPSWTFDKMCLAMSRKQFSDLKNGCIHPRNWEMKWNSSHMYYKKKCLQRKGPQSRKKRFW